MRTPLNPYRVLLAAFMLLIASMTLVQNSAAQDTTPLPELAGTWVFNEKQSDSTDDKVEAALRKMGQRARRGWFERRDDVYRGGPADQELYDRISYDKQLEIELDGDAYLFTYAGEYERPIYLDNRSRAVSLTQLDNVEDFSMGHWENGKLLVEARPRDGGFAEESYSLITNGTQLQVELYIKPRSFDEVIEIVRVFDRQATVAP
ncbi:MAG TPA: hypothetical protein VGE69_06680 [Pseudomonadales bacterium]